MGIFILTELSSSTVTGAGLVLVLVLEINDELMFKQQTAEIR